MSSETSSTELAGVEIKPYDIATDKHLDATSALIHSLQQLQQTNPKAIRSSVHLYPPSIYAPESSANAQARSRRITSWKMTEHMYFNAHNLFPTLARGLFTEEVEDGDEVPPQAYEMEAGRESPGARRVRIVARGYDKFFNIDEVDWTSVCQFVAS
jgi:tRNA ligase